MIELRKIYKYKDADVFVTQMNIVKHKDTKEIDIFCSRVEVTRDLINNFNPFFINYNELT